MISYMARDSTDLPFGDAFGPGQLTTDDDDPAELVVVLELAERHEGDRDAFDRAIADEFFPDSNNPVERAKNVRLGMKEKSGYELVTEEFEFTDIGQELYDLRDDEDALFDRFAEHILKNCHGRKLIEIVEDIDARGDTPTVALIQEAFREQYDFHISGSTSDLSQLRAWLNKADVIGTGRDYSIDRAKVEELVGASTDDVLELSGLTEEQQAFLRALTAIDPQKPMPNSEIREIAEQAYGVDINQKSIVKDILKPLTEAGYIEYVNPVEVTGKPNLVVTTDKFEADVLKPLLEDISERTGVPRHVLRASFTELWEQMDATNDDGSADTHTRGLALETMAVKLGRLLGLEFEGWHIRGRNTGGSEVDVIADRVGVSFERWQIQCKNTKSNLRTEHVKEEVGVSRMVQSNVILMIARSGVGSGAKKFATRVMFRDNLTIMFLHGDDLQKFDENPRDLLRTLRTEARRIKRLKGLDERDMVEIEEGEERANREEETLEEYEEVVEEYQNPKGGDEQNSLSDYSS